METLVKIILAIILFSTVSNLEANNTDTDITAMVIDTGVDSTQSLLTIKPRCLDNKDCQDPVGHGTHVFGLATQGELDKNYNPTSKICSRAKVYSCSFSLANPFEGLKRCYKLALEHKIKIINMSYSGDNFVDFEYDYLKKLHDIGSTLVVAAGNSGLDLSENPAYPASLQILDKIPGPLNLLEPLKNMRVVGALTTDGHRWIKSNYGASMNYEKGTNVLSTIPSGDIVSAKRFSGTSMAAALHTNRLLIEACKSAP